MRPLEAAYVGRRIETMPAQDISPVLELGSSTGHFRRQVKPHIHQQIHGPLAARGVEVVTSDYKAGEGVQISGDIFDPAVQEKLVAVKPRLLLCCNMFEHIEDRAALAAFMDRALAPGGRLIVTVPFSYPLHLDPIDTYFRPTPHQIAAMFPGYALEDAAIVSDGDAREELTSPKKLLTALRMLAPTRGLARWKVRNHRWLWLTRPYRVSVATLRKPA